MRLPKPPRLVVAKYVGTCAFCQYTVRIPASRWRSDPLSHATHVLIHRRTRRESLQLPTLLPSFPRLFIPCRIPLPIRTYTGWCPHGLPGPLFMQEEKSYRTGRNCNALAAPSRGLGEEQDVNHPLNPVTIRVIKSTVRITVGGWRGGAGPENPRFPDAPPGG